MLDPEVLSAIQAIQGHIDVINSEMGDLRDLYFQNKIIITELKNDMAWLKQFFWVLVIGIGGNLIAQWFHWKSTKKSLNNNNKNKRGDAN